MKLKFFITLTLRNGTVRVGLIAATKIGAIANMLSDNLFIELHAEKTSWFVRCSEVIEVEVTMLPVNPLEVQSE